MWRLGSILLGGFAGAVAIIVAVIAELDWECRRWNRNCYDGQGGLVLVVYAPVMFVAGGFLGSLWTWLRSKLPEHSMLAENFTGQRNTIQRISPWAALIGLWCLACFGLFRFLIFLDRS